MRYKAFLSYSRDDERIAGWLHRRLDRFKVPRALVGQKGARGSIPAKLHPVFRDRTDLSGGGKLTERIKTALTESDILIVVCSPSAANSDWVNQEVEVFLALAERTTYFRSLLILFQTLTMLNETSFLRHCTVLVSSLLT